MDNIKSIEILNKYFEGLVQPVEKAVIHEQPKLRRELYTKLRKVTEKFLDYYDESYSKENFNYSSPKADGRVKVELKIPDEKQFKDIKEYQDGFMNIFLSFYKVGTFPERVRDLFEGCLDKVKYGWYRKLAEIKEKM